MRKLYKFLRLFWIPKCRHKYKKQLSYKEVCQCSKCEEMWRMEITEQEAEQDMRNFLKWVIEKEKQNENI